MLVTGAGRSGTSTIAGVLHHLGVPVPGPHLEANPTNPLGFFEAGWAVYFHNRALRQAGVGLADHRPGIEGQVRAVAGRKRRGRLATRLRDLSAGHPITVVKDPRAAWFLPLWQRACTDAGLDLRTVVMVRHPAEVVGSRRTHYSSGEERLGAQRYAARALGGWINVMLVTELGTRGTPRCFVRYDALLADWRRTTRAIERRLGLRLPGDPERVAATDAFVDPGLRRHRPDSSALAALGVDPDLLTLAEEVFALGCRVAAGRDGRRTRRAFDAARERYARLAPRLESTGDPGSTGADIGPDPSTLR